MEPKVTIIIVNWNGIGDTIECLESLEKIDYSNYNIVVIDNGSSSAYEPQKIKQQFNNIRLVRLNQNLGFAIANNVGIRIGLNEGADYVLLLNNDTVVDAGFLKALVQVAQKDFNIGILGPKMYFYSNRNKIWYAGGKLNLYTNHATEGQYQIDSGQYGNLKRTDWVSGACMLVRKSVFEDVGLLPTEYFLNWEDIDFCLATKRKGYSCIFVPHSHVWHKASASFRRYKLGYKQVFFGFRNRIIIRYKYLTKTKFMLFIALQFIGIIPTHMLYYTFVYRDLRRIVYLWRGIICGIKQMRKRRILYNLEQV